MKRENRANRQGVIAITAKYTEFGEYHQRMKEAVSEQWDILNREMSYLDTEIKTSVQLEFLLDSSGQIHDMKVLRSTASKTATLACQDAVLSRAPFGDWSDAMIARAGNDNITNFTFYYS